MWLLLEKAHPDVTVVRLTILIMKNIKLAIRNFLTAEAPDIVALWFAGNRMKFFVDQGLI